MDDTLILLNPTAGGGRAGQAWPRLLQRFPQLEDATLVRADRASEALEETRLRLRDGKFRRLLSIGGDGTAHVATNALLGAGCGERVALGVVPAGTGSDFARHFGIPNKPRQTIQALLSSPPESRAIDAIEVTTETGEQRYSLNVASAGLSGAVDQAINASARHGDTSYLAATLQVLWRFEAKACRVTVDGELLHDGPIFLAAMGNGSYFGKGMRVAPAAEVDDGWLEVIVIPPIPRWQLPFLLPRFLWGAHVKLSRVLVRRGREVEIEPAADFPSYDLDGETLPAANARFRILPGALRLLVGG